MIEAKQTTSRRRKMRGALDALARHDDLREGKQVANSFSYANLPESNGNHACGIRPSSSVKPDGNAMASSQMDPVLSSSSSTLDYAPPPSYYASGVDAEQVAGEIRSTMDQSRQNQGTKHRHVLCSASSSSLPPPPSYEEFMSICSASRVSDFSTTRRRSSKMSHNMRKSSLQTELTVAMTFNDDDGDEASATVTDRNNDAFSSSSSASYQANKPTYFLGYLNDLPVSSDQSPSSSRDASPIAHRRPHHDSLVSMAHSLASADSVRAELERIQNIGKDVPSVASLSSRCTSKPNNHVPHDKFRGCSNRSQSSSRSIKGAASVSGLSAGLGGGGSVSSLSHLTSSGRISRGSFSSIPRMILKDDNKVDDVSYDPLSYNFVDSDSDVDPDDVEEALHTIRMEQLKIDALKTLCNDNGGALQENPLVEKIALDKECQPKDEASPPLAPLESTPQYLLAMGPKQEPAKLSPHLSIGSNTSSDNGRKNPSLERERQGRSAPPPTPMEDPIQKRSCIAKESTTEMCTLPTRKEGSWATALGA